MKVHNLVRRLEELLSAKKRARRARIDSMRQVLKKLRKKERDLEEKLRKEPDRGARKKLERKVRIAHAQRKKGVKSLKEFTRSV